MSLKSFSADYSATYLPEGESHNISLPDTLTRGLYDATLIQTNATIGFQVVFHDLYLARHGDIVQIGTGNDPSDIQSVITTIHGSRSYADDYYVHSNEMWFAVIGGLQYSYILLDVGVTAIDLPSEYNCISQTLLFNSFRLLLLIKSPEIIEVIYKCIDQPVFIKVTALL